MMKYYILLIHFCVSVRFAYSRTLTDPILNQYGGEDILVIDNDAGADDAMAISMVLRGTKASNVLIAGITCVRGNAGVHNVTENVLRTLKVNHRLEIPVMAGSDFGLIATSSVDGYFGADGFGDFDYAVPDVPLSPEHPAVFMSNIVRQNPGKVTILALAPLTNLAIAGMLDENFYRDARQIIFLGGSTSGHGGNNDVEFNIWADPTAAIAVFNRSPLDNPIMVVPTEVLHEMNFSWDWRTHILGSKGTDVINFLNLAEREVEKNPQGWKSDDPTAAAVFLHPEIVLDSYLGRPILTATGKMTVDKIDEAKITSSSDPTNEVGYIKVVGSVNKVKLQELLYELL